MQEITVEQSQPIGDVMLATELSEESWMEVRKRLNISRPTYYEWIKESGLSGR